MIRKATQNDAEAIARVHIASWHETYKGLLPDEAIAAMTNYERRLSLWNRILSDESQSSFVAVEGEKVVGFVNGGKARDEIAGYDAEIYSLYLLKAEHGKGIGRQLMTAFAKAMHEQAYKALYLWVLPNNPTRLFYQHMGGTYIKEKSFELAGQTFSEDAYAWPELRSLLLKEENNDIASQS